MAVFLPNQTIDIIAKLITKTIFVFLHYNFMHDIVCKSNINTQVFVTYRSIGTWGNPYLTLMFRHNSASHIGDIKTSKYIQYSIFSFSLACNVIYLNNVDTESLTGPQAISRAVHQTFSKGSRQDTTVATFKVSNDGITVTDTNHRWAIKTLYWLTKGHTPVICRNWLPYSILCLYPFIVISL